MSDHLGSKSIGKAPSYLSGALAVIALLLWIALVHRGLRFGTFQDDLLDYHQFLTLRESVSTDGEYLAKVISFDRTRPVEQRANFLYRPALTGFLGVEDVLFRECLPVSGGISLVIHALATLLLFAFVYRRSGSVFLALGLAAVVGSFAPGTVMVQWRMITPYLLALGLYVMGAIAWVRAADRKSSPSPALILWTLSALFHEAAAFSLGIAALAWGRTSPGDRRRGWWLWLPVMVVFALNGIDLLYRQSGGGLFSHYLDGAGAGVGGAAQWLGLSGLRFLQAIGFYSLPFFIPQAGSLSWETGQWLFPLVGLGGLGILAWAYRRIPPGDRPLFGLLGIYPLVLLALLAAIRGAAGYFYFGASTYYRHVLAFFLVLGLGGFCTALRRRSWLTGVVLLLMINQWVFGYGRIQKQVAPYLPAQQRRAEAVKAAVDYLAAGRCLVWRSPMPDFDPELPAIYLYRRSCGVSAGEPIEYPALKSALGR